MSNNGTSFESNKGIGWITTCPSKLYCRINQAIWDRCFCGTISYVRVVTSRPPFVLVLTNLAFYTRKDAVATLGCMPSQTQSKNMLYIWQLHMYLCAALVVKYNLYVSAAYISLLCPNQQVRLQTVEPHCLRRWYCDRTGVIYISSDYAHTSLTLHWLCPSAI